MDPDASRFLPLFALQPKMELLPKSRIGTVLIVLAASSALFAQSKGSGGPGNPPTALDARQIVGRSLAAADHSWQVRNEYIYFERDEDRRLDSTGKLARVYRPQRANTSLSRYWRGRA